MWDSWLASTRMDRNFSIEKREPRSPTRSWRKSTGPGLSALTARAISRSSGDSTRRAGSATAMSSARFQGPPGWAVWSLAEAGACQPTFVMCSSLGSVGVLPNGGMGPPTRDRRPGPGPVVPSLPASLTPVCLAQRSLRVAPMGRTIRVHRTAEVAPSAVVGEGSSIWNHAQVREGAHVGRECILAHGVYVDAFVQVGDRVKLENNVSVFVGARVEDGAFIGPHTCLLNDRRPRSTTAS